MFYKNTDNKVNPPNSSKDVKENSALKLERKVKVLAKRQSHRHMVALSFCLSPGQTSKMPAEKKKEKQTKKHPSFRRSSDPGLTSARTVLSRLTDCRKMIN